MAIHTGNLPRIRQAPERPRVTEERTKHGSSPATVTPMHRLHELTANAKVRLHVTGLFVVGLTALVAVLSVI